MKRTIAATIGALLLLGGCQGANNRDLEGIEFRPPDKIESFINIDGQPNISRICIDGVAFLTTSREYTSVMRITEWDGWCKS